MPKHESPKDIPQPIVDAVDAVARAGQQYGAAVTSNPQGVLACSVRMDRQQAAVLKAFRLISAELGRRYEAGIEMGQQQAEHRPRCADQLESALRNDRLDPEEG